MGGVQGFGEVVLQGGGGEGLLGRGHHWGRRLLVGARDRPRGKGGVIGIGISDTVAVRLTRSNSWMRYSPSQGDGDEILMFVGCHSQLESIYCSILYAQRTDSYHPSRRDNIPSCRYSSTFTRNTRINPSFHLARTPSKGILPTWSEIQIRPRRNSL